MSSAKGNTCINILCEFLNHTNFNIKETILGLNMLESIFLLLALHIMKKSYILHTYIQYIVFSFTYNLLFSHLSRPHINTRLK